MSYLDNLGYFFILCIFVLCLYVYFSTDEFQLKCIVSGIDGNKYCVRERNKIQEAADLLGTTTKKCKELVEYVSKKYPDKENVKRLVQNFNPQKVIEILPTSSYTAYSENKGAKIAFCLNVKKEGNKENLIDEHTLLFVAIHEISHVMTKSIGHKSEFWENFKFMLENAKEAGIHEPIDYSKTPQEYCSLKITDNPYFKI
jgi:predicted metal-dependent hydrolase